MKQTRTAVTYLVLGVIGLLIAAFLILTVPPESESARGIPAGILGWAALALGLAAVGIGIAKLVTKAR